MIRSYRLLSLLVLALFALEPLQAQLMNKGTIKFEVTDVQTNNPDMQQMIGSMKGMAQTLQFDGAQQQMTVDMMGGLMRINTFWTGANSTVETYMDMMGQKIKTIMSNEDVEKMRKESEAMIKSEDIKYDKSVTKKILGKDCYKAYYETDANGQKFSMEMYVTEDIKVPNSFLQNLNQIELKGTPLMWIMDAGMMKMTFMATDISKDLGSDFFKKPEGAYQEMSMEQLKQMGMGGQIGF
ncbi:MAG: hypothetical protein KDC53_00800 [Saprospiraceae bacterium]|nr:hypothetical protein [Saprospiraceae bacterium]